MYMNTYKLHHIGTCFDTEVILKIGLMLIRYDNCRENLLFPMAHVSEWALMLQVNSKVEAQGRVRLQSAVISI